MIFFKITIKTIKHNLKNSINQTGLILIDDILKYIFLYYYIILIL